MHRQQLITLLSQYQTRFMDEAGFIRKALSYIEQHEDCFYRELWPAHVTGSSWVVNPARDHVMMLHHRKLGQWFQPGGHADGDADIVRVALKETSEETGLGLENINLLGEYIFDVDLHDIPAMGGAPRHQHIDIRFLIEIDDSVHIPGNDESHEVRWVSLNQVSRFNNNLSTYRMVEKTRQLQRELHYSRAV